VQVDRGNGKLRGLRRIGRGVRVQRRFAQVRQRLDGTPEQNPGGNVGGQDHGKHLPPGEQRLGRWSAQDGAAERRKINRAAQHKHAESQ